MSNLITKPDFASAREIIDERIKRVMSSKFKISEGTGDISDKAVCIMQATEYVLGYEIITGATEYGDHPPCTSETITQFMIEINDAVSDRKRAKLKQVIPNIINTCPTKWNSNLLDSKPLLVRQENDPDYLRAESKRQNMIDEFQYKHTPKSGWNEGHFRWANITMTKYIPFIRELAEVAKFDTARL